MNRKPLVLVIDDDPDFQDFCQWLLGKLGYDVRAAISPAEIAAAIGRDVPEVILLDWHLGELDGTTLIDSLRRQFSLSTIVFATGYSSPEVAAAAIKLGAFDFLTKPFDEAKVTVTLAKAVEHHQLLVRLRHLELGTVDQEAGFARLIGASPEMLSVYATIRHVAPTDVNVMICGESGTGKELVADAIHEHSDRAAGPFVPLNMASIPGELAEATLFGHEKGAFTGADRERPGAVGEAAGGTLFLDEITEMPLALQGKLLRFLQERRYRPVGGRKDLDADVRIISATNREPSTAVQEKTLREDLYYRLNVVPLSLPPLRERHGDVPLLASYFIKQFARRYGKRFQGIDRDVQRLLEAHRWPGNVRELMHTMQRIVVLNDGTTVAAHMLPRDLLGTSVLPDMPEPTDFPPAAEETAAPAPAPEAASGGNGFPFSTKADIVSMDELERRAIDRAIELCGGSAYEAAHLLGISSATIYRKIKLYRVDGG